MTIGAKLRIGIGVSVALLALFFLTANTGRLLDALAKADYWYVLPAIGLYLVSVLFRTLRWRSLLHHMRVVPVVRLYPVVVVGYMANNVLPMRLGELVRSYYVGEREGVSKTSALVTVFIERLLDALTLLLFIAIIAVFVPLTGFAEAFGEKSGVFWPLLVVVLALPFVGAFAFLLLVAFAPSRARFVAMVFIRPLPARLENKLEGMVDMVLNGVKPLSSIRAILGLFALSIPVWLFEAGLFFLIGLAFDLDVSYDNLAEMAAAMVLVTAIANIGSSVPLGPGGIGLFEWVARETLILLPLAEIDSAVATGYVAVVHATLLLPMIVLGQVFLWAENVSLGALSRGGREIPGEAPSGPAPPVRPVRARPEQAGGEGEIR